MNKTGKKRGGEVLVVMKSKSSKEKMLGGKEGACQKVAECLIPAGEAAGSSAPALAPHAR